MGTAAALILAAAAATAPAGAPAPCAEPPELDRLQGCTVRECRQRSFDEAELQTGPVDESGDFQRTLIEGSMRVVTYVCPSRLTLAEIARLNLAFVRRSGYAVVYSGDMFYNDLPGFTVRKGRHWLQVVSEPFGPQTGYTVTSVTAVAEEGDPSPGRPPRKRASKPPG